MRGLAAAGGFALVWLLAAWAATSPALAQSDSPTLDSAVVDGSALTLTFSDGLDETSVPANSDFAVIVDGVAASLQGAPTVQGPIVVLSLTAPVTAAEVVTVAYSGTALRDTASAPNVVAAFGAQTATNLTPPALTSASVDAATLTLVYDAPLDETSTPDADAFIAEVSLAVRDVDAPTVSGSSVVLTLDAPVQQGQLVTVSYSPPTAGPIRSAAGVEAPATAPRDAANNTPASVPTLTDAVVDGQFLVLTYSEDLDAGATPLGSAFFADVAGFTRTVAGAEVYRNEVTLTLIAPVLAGEAVIVGYSPRHLGTSSPELQDLGGQDAAAFYNRPATNITAAPVPQLWAARAGGNQVVLVYSRMLDDTTVPANSDFAVDVAGTDRSVTGVAVEGHTVVLTLATAVAAGQPVTVDYTPGLAPIQDSAGELAGALSGRTADDSDKPVVGLAQLAVPDTHRLTRRMYPSFHPETRHYALRCSDDDTVTLLVTKQHQRTRLTINGRSVASVHSRHELRGLSDDSDIVITLTDDNDTATYVVHCIAEHFPTVTSHYTSAVSDGLMTAKARTNGDAVSFVMLLDKNGVPVLHREMEEPAGSLRYFPAGAYPFAHNVRVVPISRPSGISRSNFEIVILDEDLNEVERVTTTSEYVHTDGHDFVVKANGNYVLMAYEPIRRDLSHIKDRDGNPYSTTEAMDDSIIQEITPDGVAVFTWNSWDHVAPEDCLGHRFPGGYAHLNSLQVLDDGDIVASFRGCSQVFRIDRTTGDAVWKLGHSYRDTSPWTDNLISIVGDPYDIFSGQHAATLLDNGNLLLFDNGAASPFHPETYEERRPYRRVTRIVEYSIDTTANKATFVRDYGHRNEESFFVASSGTVAPLENGNWIMSWARPRSYNSDPNDRPPPGASIEVVDPGNPGARVLSMRVLSDGEIHAVGAVDPVPASVVQHVSVDDTAPALADAEVDADMLVLTFDEDLDEAWVPAILDFEVVVGSDPASLAAAPVVGRRTVTLTLAKSVLVQDSVEVSYGGTALRDTAAVANAVAAFGPNTVSNMTEDTTSDDATLSALTLSGVRLSPAFSSGVTSYAASVGYSVTHVTVAAAASDGNAAVEILDGNGNIRTDADGAAGFQVDLSVGENVIRVEVTAHDGVAMQTYGVTVTRTAPDLSLTPPANDPVAPFASTAVYTVRFRGLWTTTVTPEGRPGGAHFSPLIGGVHSADATFLASGGRASAGVERMAETGGTGTLRDEVRAAVDAAVPTALGVLRRSGNIGATGAGTLSGVMATAEFPRVTLTTMIAPSPDWFVGVSGLPLLDAAGRWFRAHEVDLFPWDAGTEDGTGFSLSNPATSPRGVITSIRGTGKFTTERIASLTFTLQSITTQRGLVENAPGGVDIGLPVAPTASRGSVSYTLGGTDAGSFDLVGSTGQLRTKPGATYDHDTKDSYTVTVTATDSDGAIVTTVDIAVADIDEAPQITGPTSIDFVENGTGAVAAYGASDPEGEAVTWQLAGPHGGAFELSASGVLTFKAPPNYEDQNEYEVTLRASADGELGPQTATRDVTVTVTDFDEPADISFAATRGVTVTDNALSVDENYLGALATFSASDPESKPGLTHEWSVGGTDQADFAITSAGVLSFANSPDHERPADSGRDNVYDITVNALDSDAKTGSVAVAVTVDPVNELPMITGDPAPSIEEGSTLLVGTYRATDPEDATIAPQPLAGNDSDKFEFNFNTSNGLLSFKVAPDYEAAADSGGDNVYSVTLGVSAGGHSATLDVAVTVTNTDEPGVVVFSSPRPQADADYTATLSDPDDVLSTVWAWERSTSRSGPWTAISGATGGATASTYRPTAGDVGYYLKMTADYTDAHGPNKRHAAVSAHSVNAAPDANVAPSFDERTPTRSIPENARARAAAGTPVRAADTDSGDVVAYELSGSDLFTVDSDSGQIRVAAGESLDFEAAPSHSVALKASDSSNASDTVTVTIAVTDVNERPDAVADTATVSEDAAVTIDVLANDDDPEDDRSALTITVARSPRRGRAVVNQPANAGQNPTITYTPNADYHGADTFTYEVRDTASPSLSNTAAVSVEINPVNDPPSFTSPTTTRSVSESAGPGDNVGAPVTATDPDENDTLAYSLSGADAGLFDIGPHSGQITVGDGVVFDIATNDTYTVTVDADDANGGRATVVMTIAVTADTTATTVTTGPTGPGRLGSGGSSGGGGSGLSASTAVVIVANGWSPPDIGVAAALSARTPDSAVIYTTADRLSVAARKLLVDYQPAGVIVVGGEAAVSASVLTSMRSASESDSLERIIGATRSDTAAAVARRILDASGGGGGV
ncbi:SwmB domain-containing protein [Candidatus Poriferisodalis sp.]|uniref:SwmB domain-containing protein n=1 Tax=Candidatus Poriferisodalis sp. TaxID=3101277 RepID=UPI003AF6F6E7